MVLLLSRVVFFALSPLASSPELGCGGVLFGGVGSGCWWGGRRSVCDSCVPCARQRAGGRKKREREPARHAHRCALTTTLPATPKLRRSSGQSHLQHSSESLTPMKQLRIAARGQIELKMGEEATPVAFFLKSACCAKRNSSALSLCPKRPYASSGPPDVGYSMRLVRLAFLSTGRSLEQVDRGVANQQKGGGQQAEDC